MPNEVSPWEWSKRRAEKNMEGRHFLWLRNDLWELVKQRKALTGKSYTETVHEALYNLLAKDKISYSAGREIDFDESPYSPKFKKGVPKNKNKYLPDEYEA